MRAKDGDINDYEMKLAKMNEIENSIILFTTELERLTKLLQSL